MSERARLVYALLRTFLAWTPAPRSRSDSITGFVSSERPCLHCQAYGRRDKGLGRKVDAGCPHCGGTGVRPVKDVMDDPLRNPPAHPLRKTGFGGVSGDDAREARRRRDEEIKRLGQQLSQREEDAPPGVFERSVELRDRMYRHGSYAELERALARLRLQHEGYYRLAMFVAYQPFGEAPIEPIRPAVIATCELLAAWMPASIRVPAGVHVWTKDELEQRSREAKAALQYGRSEWAAATRAERKRMILLLHGEGLSDGKIAARFGLSRGWVQRIRAGLEDAFEERVA